MQKKKTWSVLVLSACVLLVTLVCVTVYVWKVALASNGSGELRVVFLDVGQGDAVYVETPGGRQVLIDGGRGQVVLRELGAVMPYSDRGIDVVVATHPDYDHIGGLPAVFERFAVGMFIEPGVADDGADYAALLAAVEHEGVSAQYARGGMSLVLEEGVVLDVLSPNTDVHNLEPNRGSVVARLTYGDTAFMLTGDAPVAIEEYLVGVYGEALKSTVLKLGHHGSKTSTSELLLGFVDPDYAVVSAACDNQYGHPHEEVLAQLARFDVQVSSTCVSGRVTFVSDSVQVRLLRS